MLPEHLSPGPSFPSLPSPSSPATFIKSLSMITHTSVDSVLWFLLLNALQFLATPVTHFRSWTLPLPLASRKKKSKKKPRYPFSVLQADQDLDPSGLTLSVITFFLTLTSVLSLSTSSILCLQSLSLYKSTETATESFVMCHCWHLPLSTSYILHSTALKSPRMSCLLYHQAFRTLLPSTPLVSSTPMGEHKHTCAHTDMHTLFPSPPSFISWLEEVVLGTFLVA